MFKPLLDLLKSLVLQVLDKCIPVLESINFGVSAVSFQEDAGRNVGCSVISTCEWVQSNKFRHELSRLVDDTLRLVLAYMGKDGMYAFARDQKTVGMFIVKIKRDDSEIREDYVV